MLRRRNVDDLLEPDDSLEEVSVTSSSSSERVQKLMSKQPNRSRSLLDTGRFAYVVAFPRAPLENTQYKTGP